MEVLLPTEDRLPTEVLAEKVSGVAWHNLVASGVKGQDQHVPALEEAWEAHLAAIGRKTIGQAMEEFGPVTRTRVVSRDVPEKSADALLEALEGQYYRAEAAFRRRNRRLIEAKKELSDGKCSVCQFNFTEKYVHHVKPIGKRGRATKTTVDDIELLCPNCHSAVHTTDPPLAAEALREMLSD